MSGPFDDLIPSKSPPGSLAPRTSPRFVPTGSPDPYKPAAEARAQAGESRAERDQRIAEEKAARDRLEWNATHNPDGSLKPKSGEPSLNPVEQQFIKELQIDNMLAAIAQARKIVSAGGATGVMGQLGSAFRGSAAQDLSGTLDTIRGNISLDRMQQLKEASKTGASGLGSLTEREGRMLSNSVAALNDEMSAPLLLKNLGVVERNLRRMQAVGAGKNPDDPAVAKAFGILGPNDKPPAAPAPPANPGAEPEPSAQMELSQERLQAVPDPTLKGLNRKVAAMIRAGKGDEVPAYLESIRPGLSQNVHNLPQWINFIGQNPDYKGPISVSVDKKLVPVGMVQGALNKAAQSDIGAGIIGAADNLTFGTLDNMTSNPALTRVGMSEVQAEHPKSYLSGQILGQASLGALGEGALVARGMGAGRAALLSDMASGAAYGAGSADEGNRGLGALLGAGAGLAGNRAGAGLSRVIGGVTDPYVGYLARENVRMTPGQLFGGLGKSLEDRAAGFWGVGDLIRGQRNNGIEDYNRAAWRQGQGNLTDFGAQPITGVGQQAAGQADDALNVAYGGLSGAHSTVDPQFVTDMGSALNSAGSLPRVGPEIRDTLDEVIPGYFNPGAAPTLPGENIRPLISELRGVRSSYRTDPLGHRIGGRVREAEDAITGMVGRQNPDAIPRLDASNAANTRFSILDDATLRAEANGGMFMPSQLGGAQKAAKQYIGGRGALAAGEGPFAELVRAGQEVLPSQIPDSGTAGRLAIVPGALALGGGGAGAAMGADGEKAQSAGAGTVAGLGVAGALLSPYLMRGALQRILTAPRTAEERMVADFIGRSRLPGSLAVPALAAPSAEGM